MVHIFAIEHESELKKASTQILLKGEYAHTTLSDVATVLPELINAHRMPNGEVLTVNITFSYAFTPTMYPVLGIVVMYNRPCLNEIEGVDFQRNACEIIYGLYTKFSKGIVQNLLIETTGVGATSKDIPIQKVTFYDKLDKNYSGQKNREEDSTTGVQTDI